MKQKLQDIMLLVQRDRKAQAIAIGIALCIAFVIFSENKNSRYVQTANVDLRPPNNQSTAGAMGPQEAYGDLMKRFSSDVEQLKQQANQSSKILVNLKGDLDTYETRTAEIFKRILERVNELETIQQNSGAEYAPPYNPDDQMVYMEDQEDLTAFGDMSDPKPAPPPAPRPKRVAIISPGDAVRIKLLAGVQAPTDGVPYPVLFKLINDVTGPDGSALSIGEARLIAAAQGSLVDSRALFRLNQLSLRLPNGQRVTLPVDGWVVGEDGIRGMEGILIDPIGKAIGGAVATSGVAAIGQGIADANTTNYNDIYGSTSLVTGDTMEYAAGRGLAAGANAWDGIIRDRVRRLTPHVKVLSGREATAVFSNAVRVPALYDMLNDEEDDFVGLD